MLINIQNKKDVITVDIRCHQIRYLKNIAKRGPILYYSMSPTESECFEILYNQVPDKFLSTVTETLLDNLDVKIKVSDFKIITTDEYLQLLK